MGVLIDYYNHLYDFHNVLQFFFNHKTHIQNFITSVINIAKKKQFISHFTLFNRKHIFNVDVIFLIVV